MKQDLKITITFFAFSITIVNKNLSCLTADCPKNILTYLKKSVFTYLTMIFAWDSVSILFTKHFPSSEVSEWFEWCSLMMVSYHGRNSYRPLLRYIYYILYHRDGDFFRRLSSWPQKSYKNKKYFRFSFISAIMLSSYIVTIDPSALLCCYSYKSFSFEDIFHCVPYNKKNYLNYC